MSEKKAKEQRKKAAEERAKAPKVVNVITIKQFDNGAVTVDGPIRETDSWLFRDIMNKAERVALTYLKQNKEPSRILVPGMKMGLGVPQ